MALICAQDCARTPFWKLTPLTRGPYCYNCCLVSVSPRIS